MSSIKVDDRAYKKMVRTIMEAFESGVKVGVLSNDMHPGGKDGKAQGKGISMVELAAIHEYGAPAANIPERSFIRTAFQRPGAAQEFRALSGKVAGAVITGKMSGDTALEVLGHQGATAIKKNIQAGIEPENAPATIRKKKSSKPLVDTGRLINSITHKVE